MLDKECSMAGWERMESLPVFVCLRRRIMCRLRSVAKLVFDRLGRLDRFGLLVKEGDGRLDEKNCCRVWICKGMKRKKSGRIEKEECGVGEIVGGVVCSIRD
jgi:hypothetical protein